MDYVSVRGRKHGKKGLGLVTLEEGVEGVGGGSVGGGTPIQGYLFLGEGEGCLEQVGGQCRHTPQQSGLYIVQVLSHETQPLVQKQTLLKHDVTR